MNLFEYTKSEDKRKRFAEYEQMPLLEGCEYFVFRPEENEFTVAKIVKIEGDIVFYDYRLSESETGTLGTSKDDFRRFFRFTERKAVLFALYIATECGKVDLEYETYDDAERRIREMKACRKWLNKHKGAEE